MTNYQLIGIYERDLDTWIIYSTSEHLFDKACQFLAERGYRKITSFVINGYIQHVQTNSHGRKISAKKFLSENKST